MGDEDFVYGALLVIFVGAITAFMTWGIANSHWRSECIDKGVAEYNQTTGEWQWKEEFR